MPYFYYRDSIGTKHRVDFKVNEYCHLMELIWDQGLEDWGDCKGRAWCGTCHVSAPKLSAVKDMDQDESVCQAQLPNRTADSRLSCQIHLKDTLQAKEIEYLGDE